MSLETYKKAAAEHAVSQVKSGMVLGLGSGSTTKHVVYKIGELWQSGELKDIVSIPTSEETANWAKAYNLPLGTLTEYPVIDLAIDGADEIDSRLNLIKGKGGALLREKMIETVAQRFVVVVDHSKISKKLGLKSPLPLEVVRFGWGHQTRWLTQFGCLPVLRGGEHSPFVTDNGNYIVDCYFPHGIDTPYQLADILDRRVGVVEHGFFLDFASEAVIAGPNGIKTLRANSL